VGTRAVLQTSSWRRKELRLTSAYKRFGRFARSVWASPVYAYVQRNPFLRLTSDLQLQSLTLQTFASNQGCASFEAARRKLEFYN
jgi:DNA-binding transcriptional regulator PaaX